MFIVQVIFESEKDNIERIKAIMEKKKSDAAEADENLLSYELWWKEGTNTVGFSMVTKWANKESFKKWMKETHKDGHKKASEGSPIVNKTVYQFESIE